MSRIQPRLMRTEDAAEYCGGLSVSSFMKDVAPHCRKLNPSGRRVAWDRHDLDAWIDWLAGLQPQPSGDAEPQPKRANPLEALI